MGINYERESNNRELRARREIEDPPTVAGFSSKGQARIFRQQERRELEDLGVDYSRD